MALKTYIGARYTPKYMGEWNKQTEYGPLSVVSVNEDANYVSKKVVPVNTEITNTKYWLKVASWNAQVEQYNQNVNIYRRSVEEYKLAVEAFYADTIHAYDNKAAMIADTSLKEGETVITCGRDTIGDGHGSFYQVVSTDDATTVQLANGLYAKPFVFKLYEDKNTQDNHATTKKEYYFHLNSTTGNDENDGLTASTAFKTMQHIFDMLNTGHTNIHVTVHDNAIYEVKDYYAISCINLHLNSTEPAPFTIYFKNTTHNVAFYGCHINWQNCIIKNDGDYSVYFEGCTTKLDKVLYDSDGGALFYGGHAECSDLTCRTFHANYTIVNVTNLTTTCDIKRAVIVLNQCARARFAGTLSVTGPTDETQADADFISASGTDLQWFVNIVGDALSTKWARTTISNCMLFINSTRKNALTAKLVNNMTGVNQIEVTGNYSVPPAETN